MSDARIPIAQRDLVAAYVREKLQSKKLSRTAPSCEKSVLLSYKQQEYFAAELSDLHASDDARQFIILALEQIDIALLRAAIFDVIALQEALRLRIISIGDGHYTADHFEAKAFDVLLYDYSKKSDDEVEQGLRRIALEKYDLIGGGQLCRAAIYQRDRTSAWVVFAAHHIVFDYWSLGLVMSNLAEAYARRSGGVIDAVPTLEERYCDFAAWQRSPPVQERIGRERKFWEGLHRIKITRSWLTLCQGDREAPRKYRPEKLPVSLSGERVRAARGICQKTGASLYAVVLANFLLTLRSFEAEQRVLIGMPTLGRPRAQLYRTIGLFANTLTLPVNIPNEVTGVEFLNSVKTLIARALTNQTVSGEIVQRMAPFRFQYMILLQMAQAIKPELPGVKSKVIALDVGHNGNADYGELCVSLLETEEFSESADELVGYIDFNGVVFTTDSMREFWIRYGLMLDAMAEQLNDPLLSMIERAKELDLLSCSARR